MQFSNFECYHNRTRRHSPIRHSPINTPLSLPYQALAGWHPREDEAFCQVATHPGGMAIPSKYFADLARPQVVSFSARAVRAAVAAHHRRAVAGAGERGRRSSTAVSACVLVEQEGSWEAAVLGAERGCDRVTFAAGFRALDCIQSEVVEASPERSPPE